MIRAAALAAFVAACGGSRSVHAADPRDRASCEAEDGITPADLDATPRPDRATEQLALTLSDRLTADGRIYDRLVRDLGAMRRANPSVAAIEYRAPDDGATLFLFADGGGEDWVPRHPGFERLRARFRAKNVSYPYHWVALTFDDVYDLRGVGEYFRRLGDVPEIGTNVLTGDGPSICVEPDGETWTTYFLDASGDCPAGCIDMRIVAFRSDAAGTITRLGEVDAAAGPSPLLEAAWSCGRKQLDRISRPRPPACAE